NEAEKEVLLEDNTQLREKAFTSWNGGKEGEGVYHFIINHLPECDTFIEAMAGNFTVARKLSDDCDKWVNEIDTKTFGEYESTIHWHKSNFTFTNCDYKIIFNILCDNKVDYGRIVLFLDPPYRFATRQGQGNIYKHEFT